MRYFKKEILSNRLYLPNGALAPWEDVGGDTGTIGTDEAGLIVELAKCANTRRGGVSEILADDYLELKKKPPENRWLQKSLEQQNLLNPRFSRANAAGNVAEAKPKPLSAPLEVPKEIPMPLVTSLRLAREKVAQNRMISEQAKPMSPAA